MKQLILGGARSGKSALAEKLAADSGREVVYIATATQGDAEMADRIALHRQRRPAHWHLLEEPLNLAQTLEAQAAEGRCLLVDCLTLWLSNLLFIDDGIHFQPQRDALLERLPQLPGEIILVSNEVSMGIVPLGEISRRFQDESGLLHQNLAGLCDRVLLTVAGLPVILKGPAL
ncbi:MAG: bifunctional adenosylcobinamide kinase/adenosylcobinamide-phosphate guanylyltransferase [Motiliproteus sp.]